LRSRFTKWVIGAVVIAGCVVAFLLATGDRSLSLRSPRPERPLDVSRLDAAQTEGLGWSATGLDAVFSYAATLSTDTMLIATDGRIVASFGDLAEPHQTHSIRKALLSALVGQHAGDGPDRIRLEATLQALGIDDAPIPLTPLQRQATVRHLLKSLSGINHPAAAEAGLTAEKDRLLGPGENRPGTRWAYNNWDYNALTTVFEQQTGTTIAEAFRDGIAEPLGLKDFSVADVAYREAPERSQHRAVAFRLSARDLARFGQLYLDNGEVDGQQVVPADWIDLITNDFTKTGRDDLRWGHGYMWWLPNPDIGLPEGTFWAWGLGNQALFVIPAWNTVIVHQSDTTAFLGRFLPMLKTEAPAEKAIEQLIRSCSKRENRDSEYCIDHRFTTRREFSTLIALVGAARL